MGMRDDDDSLAQDYASFIENTAPLSMPIESAAVTHRIRKDLVRSPRQMALIYSGLSVVGYGASLAVCAQNAFGLSGLSHSVAFRLHQLPDPWCPILCGSVFTGIPFLLSLLFLNRFQHRFLLFRMWWFLVSIPLVATGLMMMLPSDFQHGGMNGTMADTALQAAHLSSSAWMGIWAASAILVPYALAGLVYLVVRPRRYVAARA